MTGANSVLPRFLGWLSVGLGTLEVLAPGLLARTLGTPGGPMLIRVLGLREIGAGVLTLCRPASPAGPAARALGDCLDIAVLAPALSRANGRRGSAAIALCMVLGITTLDLLCARNRS